VAPFGGGPGATREKRAGRAGGLSLSPPVCDFVDPRGSTTVGISCERKEDGFRYGVRPVGARGGGYSTIVIFPVLWSWVTDCTKL
jgi:hypothetical protein